MCEIPQQWTPPCAGLLDAQSEQYYQELEEIFAEMRIIQAQLSLPLVQYRCCSVTWWTVDPRYYQQQQPHCFICMNQCPQLVPPEERSGYAMFRCDLCFYTWAGSDPRATEAEVRGKQQCQRSLVTATGRCSSTDISLVMIGPLQIRLAFQRFHWLRRRLWRITNNVQDFVVPTPTPQQPELALETPADRAAAEAVASLVNRKCPRPGCGFVGLYTNGSAKRCQQCKRPVFSQKSRRKMKIK